jgi:hypothetical protein
MDLVILGVVDSRSSSRFPGSSERISGVEGVYASHQTFPALDTMRKDIPAAGPKFVTPAVVAGARGLFAVASTLDLVVAICQLFS